MDLREATRAHLGVQGARIDVTATTLTIRTPPLTHSTSILTFRGYYDFMVWYHVLGNRKIAFKIPRNEGTLGFFAFETWPAEIAFPHISIAGLEQVPHTDVTIGRIQEG